MKAKLSSLLLSYASGILDYYRARLLGMKLASEELPSLYKEAMGHQEVPLLEKLIKEEFKQYYSEFKKLSGNL